MENEVGKQPTAKSSTEQLHMNSPDRHSQQGSLFAPKGIWDTKTTGGAYLLSCPPGQVFRREKQLEHAILEDERALHALGTILGTTIRSVANQVRTLDGLQDQADIVIYDDTARARAVVELMLGALGRDHLYRALVYAITLRASQVVLVAHTFPNRTRLLTHDVREWLDAQGVRMKILHMRLETFDARPNGGTGYRLMPIAPVDVTPERPAPILEAYCEAVIAMGDESLKGLTFTENRKL